MIGCLGLVTPSGQIAVGLQLDQGWLGCSGGGGGVTDLGRMRVCRQS